MIVTFQKMMRPIYKTHETPNRMLLAFVLVLTISSSAAAQHFLTVGPGFALRVFKSEKLNHFTDTYNLDNFNSLATLLNGFDGSEGLRFEVGYRYWKHYTAAVSLGWMTFTRKDNATFTNNETRLLELKSNSFYLEYEAGRPFGDFFVNGVLAFFFNRNVKIEAAYFDANGRNFARRLNGNYRGATAFSGDLGIAVGMYRKPIFLVAKITYPFFATDKSDRLRDERTAKQEDGSALFPDDYINFKAREPYDGVPNDLDGLKISLTVMFSLEL